MSDAGAVHTAPAGLLARPAGYSVIDRCLREQASVAPRSWLASQLGLSPLAPQARSWYSGALGELAVARILTSLGAEWTVLHSLPLGPRGADVDHLLIGPSGVYTVNTKAVRAPVWVGRARILIGGRRVDYIAAAEREARRVHVELTRATGTSVYVHPMLVFVKPPRMTIREAPASVTVLTADRLVRWLVKQERIYPADRIAEIVRAADDPETWHTPLDHDETLLRQVQRFERLQASVAEASRRWRMTRLAAALWGVTALVAVMLLVVPAALAALLT